MLRLKRIVFGILCECFICTFIIITYKYVYVNISQNQRYMQDTRYKNQDANSSQSSNINWKLWFGAYLFLEDWHLVTFLKNIASIGLP